MSEQRNNFLTRIISPLEKCFDSDFIQSKPVLRRTSALPGQYVDFQLAVFEGELTQPDCVNYRVRTVSELSEISVRKVNCVPDKMPCYHGRCDESYISDKPGLYPDLLLPLGRGELIHVRPGQLLSLWLQVYIPDDCAGGEYDVTVILQRDGVDCSSDTLTIKVIPACLPEQTLLFTEWFHCDCLASYYNVPVFSEEHWRIIGNFMKTARKNGINTLLTPVFTPPLDTAVGSERPTVQLADIYYKDGGYTFSFEKLGRWLRLCAENNITHFEIPHFFTQWGAHAAPKIVAHTETGLKRIFGWETDASEGEYPRFLKMFIPALLAYLKEEGVDKNCIFHVSDEPSEDHMEQYSKSRAVVAPLLEGYTTIDALSSIEFWKQGYVPTPVPALDHIKPFLDAGIDNLWTYYCCGQNVGVSNRFIAQHSYVNRILGIQLYKFNITGFLQWGYNFWYNAGSQDFINPYSDTTGDLFVPGGDAFSVYPLQNGEAAESIRIAVFREALEDLRALKLLESLSGREAALAAADPDGTLTFDSFPHSASELLKTRERINAAIEKAILNNANKT